MHKETMTGETQEHDKFSVAVIESIIMEKLSIIPESTKIAGMDKKDFIKQVSASKTIGELENWARKAGISHNQLQQRMKEDLEGHEIDARQERKQTLTKERDTSTFKINNSLFPIPEAIEEDEEDIMNSIRKHAA